MEGGSKYLGVRPPLVFGWNIREFGSVELLRVIKLTESLGIPLVSINLNAGTEEEKFLPLCGSDLVLSYNYWSQRVIAKIDDIDDCLKPYMDWTAYVGLRAVCITCEYAFHDAKGLHELHELLANFSQKLNAFFSSPNVPTVVLSFMPTDVSWGHWKAIHEMTNYSPHLKVAILLDESTQHNLERWKAEPLAAVILTEDYFVRKDGHVHVKEGIAPQLKFFLNYNVKLMLTGDYDFKAIRDANLMRSNESLELNGARILEATNQGGVIGIKEAMASIKALYATLPPLTDAEKFREQYLDMLQEPLQPVRDNLDTVTYEHFERCPVKYANYQKAVDLWLKDYLNGTIDGNVGKPKGKVPVIFVVGAGRGPLVDCVLRAMIANGISDFSLYAMEKNPATIYALKHKVAANAIEGWKNVKLIFQDMRDFKAPEPADLVVSELLGSFGDNELAPECIDGIQRVMEMAYPGHNITFIPSSSTSYVEPIYCPKVWASLSYVQARNPFHHAYTVALHRVYNIVDKPRPCFKFEHPCKQLPTFNSEIVEGLQCVSQNSNNHNDRYISMAFKAEGTCHIHGFAGYFECTLYRDVVLSTLPGVMDDQISWFPIFFPLSNPVPVKESDPIVVHVWRRHDVRRMWYEWALTLPHVTAVHNANGSGHAILR